jgi:hypothetical protein
MQEQEIVKETFMNLEGFIPYDSASADLYEKKRWWLGMTLGDMLDKASDLYPQKDALIGSGVRYTYAQVRRRVDTMAYRLLQTGFPQLAGIRNRLLCITKSRFNYGAAHRTSYRQRNYPSGRAYPAERLDSRRSLPQGRLFTFNPADDEKNQRIG